MFVRNSTILIFFLSLCIACSTSEKTSIERGHGYNFKPGYPEFRASAFGFIDEVDGPTLQVRAEISTNSLSFRKEGDSLSAKFALDFHIRDLDNPDNIISTKHFERKITKIPGQKTEEELNIEHTFQVDPSRYEITATLTDQSSQKDISQTFESYIPDTNRGAYSLSKIQLYGKQVGQDWTPINTYDVKGKVDSLRFVFQLISDKSDKQMQIDSKLIRFESDTSYTRPMHYANYSSSSIEYKGIEYDETTELSSNKRILTEYGSIFIEYKFPNQARGNYRFEVTAQKKNSEEVYKARAFGIKSKSYPELRTPRELARPLVYLMKRDEYEDLMAISDPDSLKRAIDRFWLKNIGNATKAKNVLQLYYERVEQANKQFSNFKEGWKTDFGMIYILFGPPLYTEDHLKEEIWFYSYNREDPEYRFQFEQPKQKNRYYPFYHFILERRGFYYTRHHIQQQLWLSGQILTRRI